jgi:hypothetical protein
MKGEIMADNQTIQIKRPINVPDFVLKQHTDASQPKEKYPTETVPIATKGWFYPEGHPLSSGEIELKQVTAREEDILANQELIKKGTVLDKFMESLIINKSIKIDEIFIPDKNSIFIAIRRLAYGDDYNVQITCPTCSSKNKVVINLGELRYKDFNFEEHPKGQNNFTYKLPSGITITYKLLNQIDEKSIDIELNNLKKISKEASGEITTRMKYLITSVDGNTDKMMIRKFIDEKLTSKDSLSFRKYIKENNPDVDMTFDFKCLNCDLERRLDMPLGVSFLWPDVES